jgi:hypothetical protein
MSALTDSKRLKLRAESDLTSTIMRRLISRGYYPCGTTDVKPIRSKMTLSGERGEYQVYISTMPRPMGEIQAGRSSDPAPSAPRNCNNRDLPSYASTYVQLVWPLVC